MSDETSTPLGTTPIAIEDEMRASYLDYAMSVIIGRALPDVRDGLKPVHRRVLFAMHDLANSHNRAHKKSARIVGDVIGKYHPHGDQAVYDALVRMAQDFSMRHMLIDGQGNFGSVDGDPPAAMRYTEIRMAKISSEILADIDKETVDFIPNYDDSLSEPTVMPTRVPNLLINGGSGIAVGMATNIPPHNLSEVINGTIALVENKDLTTKELMQYIPGPDFPTGGIVYGTGPLLKAYETGRGIIKVRGRANIEEGKKRDRIIITEIPYQVNKTSLIERLAGHVRDKKIEGIRDIRDESNRKGMRIVIELKKDASGDIVLNQLYAHTALQSSFGYNLLAIVNGQPKVLSLKEILKNFIDHRREVVTRRSLFELREAEKRFNVVFGLLVAIDSLDRVIEIIRAAKDTNTAKQGLMNEKLQITPAFKTFCGTVLTFKYDSGESALERGYVLLNERQAQAILDMRLARLTGLEREKLNQEALSLRGVITDLSGILASETRLKDVIINELKAIQESYTDERRSELVQHAGQFVAEDLIVDEDVVVTISHMGYVKRNPIDLYRAQRRGGRGKTAATTRDEDFVENVFVASTHSYVLIFTDQGKVYWLKVHEIPQAGRTSRGKPIINLLRTGKNEKIAAVLPVKEFSEGLFVSMVSAKGYIKKTDLMVFSSPRPSGLIALTIEDNDALIGVSLTNGEQDVLIATRMGQAIRFSEKDVRPMGRTARGVRALNLKKDGDAVVGKIILDDPSKQILTVSELGYGKRTSQEEYRTQGRGGSGIINCKLTSRNGPVISVCSVGEEDEIMIISDRGMMIRMPVNQISSMGRSTQGVRLINMRPGEKIASIAPIIESS
jgi:DNA gyrase subunit A